MFFIVILMNDIAIREHGKTICVIPEPLRV